MSRGFFLVLFEIAIAFIVGTPTTVLAQDYVKLASKDPVIHVVGGSGSEKFYFSKKHDSNLPELVVATDATGRSGTIPVADIKLSSPADVATDVFIVTVTVGTLGYIEPGAPYECTLLLYGKKTGVPPVPIKFTIEDDSGVGFEVSPKTITVAVTDDASAHQRIQVTNTGKASIGNFEITSSTLVDPTNAHRTQMTQANRELPLALLPGQTMDLEFDLPQPPRAGTYTGTISVFAGSSVHKEIALTLQTRGPYNQRGLPLILFVVLVGVGFGVSTLLDNWFGGGGLARAQAYLSIKASEKQLKEVADNIENWRKGLPAPPPLIELPSFEVWLDRLLQDINGSWKNFQSATAVQVAANADEYSAGASAASYFWGSVKFATDRWSSDPQKMKQAIDKMDAVLPPSSVADLVRYRKDLDTALRSVAAPAATATQAAAVAAQAASVPILGKTKWSQRSVNAQIRFMNVFYQIVIGAVVLLTAYMSFYSGHLAFGTAVDYIAVFLWSLGLTTTGTQIISRVHRP